MPDVRTTLLVADADLLAALEGQALDALYRARALKPLADPSGQSGATLVECIVRQADYDQIAAYAAFAESHATVPRLSVTEAGATPLLKQEPD